MCYNYGERKGENKYMRKRSEKPLGKQQKKNREVLKYEEIKTELTNISPAERRRKRIMAETDVKSASKFFNASMAAEFSLIATMTSWIVALHNDCKGVISYIVLVVVIVAAIVTSVALLFTWVKKNIHLEKTVLTLEILDEFFPNSKQKK